MIVLDSDVVTLLSYGKNHRLNHRVTEAEKAQTLALTIITCMEILQGRFASIRNAADAEQLQLAMQWFLESERFLAAFVRLDVNEAASHHFSTLLRGKKTRKMRRGDMLIASIALGNNAILVTRNVKDYKDVPGLTVENWVD